MQQLLYFPTFFGLFALLRLRYLAWLELEFPNLRSHRDVQKTIFGKLSYLIIDILLLALCSNFQERSILNTKIDSRKCIVIGCLSTKRFLAQRLFSRSSLKVGFVHPYEVPGDLLNPDSKGFSLLNLLGKMTVPELAKIFLCDT